ncbi:MAG: hypothetical protein SGI90_15370 [Candidatus Eisenbacteria bacterium]|nr:hypothetical protein [Candidatus Eisenbacteria bacterium]
MRHPKPEMGGVPLRGWWKGSIPYLKAYGHHVLACSPPVREVTNGVPIVTFMVIVARRSRGMSAPLAE